MLKLKEVLKDLLTPEELALVPRSYDIIGSREKAVAIVEIPEGLEGKEELVAKAIMSLHKNVKSVLAKASERRGIYRTRELRLIAGDPDTEVVHKEHGCLFKLDPRKVYFSPREATERLRIAKRVKPGEKVLVMFSGVCPYPIMIAKKQPLVEKVIGVEINPDAHRYALENVKLNKVEGKVLPILGDVRDVCPKLGEKFDRVVMPLPKGAHEYLDVAIPRVKKGGVLHFYHWAREDDLFSEAEGLVVEEAERMGRKATVLERRKVLPYAPRVWKVRVDFRLT